MYKMIHRDHHRVYYKVMNYKHTYVGHIIEGPFQGMGILVPLLFIENKKYIFLLSLLIINIRGMLRHDKRYIWLIGNHHILHHKYPQYNYGEYWLDNLLGTKCPYNDEYVYGVIYI